MDAGGALGRVRLGSRAAEPHVRLGAPSVSGSLPPELIARFVRQRISLLSHCYEHGLAKSLALKGRVEVAFVADPSGRVSSAGSSRGTSLSDATVVSCVVDVFRALELPRPRGGDVTVLLPVTFDPPD
jgi:hypothetical protein